MSPSITTATRPKVILPRWRSTSPKGTNYLKSELAYVKNANVGVYQFGQGYYEADAGDTYLFKYSYGNGDYYTGKMYANPAGMYYPGYTKL